MRAARWEWGIDDCGRYREGAARRAPCDLPTHVLRAQRPVRGPTTHASRPVLALLATKTQFLCETEFELRQLPAAAAAMPAPALASRAARGEAGAAAGGGGPGARAAGGGTGGGGCSHWVRAVLQPEGSRAFQVDGKARTAQQVKVGRGGA